MRARATLRTAGLQRAVIEAGLLVALLMFPVALVFAGSANNLRWAMLFQAGFELGLLAGLIVVIRLRSAGSSWRRLANELGRAAAAAAAVWIGVALSVFTGLAVAGWSDVAGSLGLDLPQSGAVRVIADPIASLQLMTITGASAAIGAIFSYLLLRGLLTAWSRWNQLRRRRLRWALTHSLLVASLIVATTIAIVLTASAVTSGFVPTGFRGLLPASAPLIQRVLATIVLTSVPAIIVLFVVPLLVGVLIVPPVALIAFPVLGRATRRLETLTRAAGALRSGDLSARAPVSGEDEIARLQADFNTMAADLERTLVELRAERDAVGRLLDARRELVASVSHELRTPLATLRGYLDSTLEHWDERLPDSLLSDLKVMSGEADRLDHLIEDLFTVSRAEVGRLPLAIVVTDVSLLLRRVVSALAPLAWNHGRVEVVAQIPETLPPGLADPERLEQIMRNLLTNAVRHTPPGGLVLVSAAPEADMIEIQVRDTGEGIDPDELPLIWDRFYRAGNARDRSGAGLGLALVKELAEAMGGSVSAESTPGDGSCFSVRIPLAPPAATGQLVPAPEPEQLDAVSGDRPST